MKCKNCKREIDDHAIFCQWCGERQIKERRGKGGVKVPEPRKLASGRWNIELRAEGVSVTEDTPELCRAKAMAIRAGFIAEQKSTAGKLTLRQAIQAYLNEYENALSPSTVRGYEIIKRNRFLGKMGKPISQTDGWQAEIDAAAKKYAPKTIKNDWGLVTSIMRRNNIPVPHVILPQQRENTTPWLTYQQILIFIDAIRGEYFETAALFALHSLRLSEIYALTWDHIDLEEKTFEVSGAVVRNKANNLVRKPENKNKSSRRKIKIMIPELYKKLCEMKDAGLPPVRGVSTSLCSWINRICEQNGLPRCGVHGLRRSFASLAYHLDLSALVVKEIGGWRDINTVNKFYLKLAREDRLSSENQMERFYTEHSQQK